MAAKTEIEPRDYRLRVPRRPVVTRSSDTAKPGDLILSSRGVLRVQAAA